MSVNYLSAEGLKKIQEELADLRNVKRKEATARIAAAEALGDISENAEYHEAKEAQALIEGRIFEIEELLKNVQLFDEAAMTGSTKVRIGSTVTVSVNGKEKVFTIVGSNEADPLTGKISNESPIGQALLAMSVGQTVSVRTPAGENVYKIVHIA